MSRVREVAHEGARVRGLALLGCGRAARTHARVLARVRPGLRCYFASRDGARAREHAERYGAAGWFDGYEAALESPRVDAVSVVTPPATHRQWTLAALEAGKHVLVEKPAFTRSADFDEVASAAARAGRRVLVTENYPYKPLAGALRRLLEERLLGRLLSLDVDARKRQRAEGWRDDPSLAGGGALLEGGIHWVSLLAHLGPRVVRVRAAAPVQSAGLERSIHVRLDYEGGGVASLAHSWEAPSLTGGLRLSYVRGTEGTATFESNGLFLLARGARWRARLWVRDVLGFAAMHEDLFAALESGREPRYTLADARHDVALVEQAYRDAGFAAPASPPPPRHPRPRSGRDEARDGSATGWSG